MASGCIRELLLGNLFERLTSCCQKTFFTCFFVDILINRKHVPDHCNPLPSRLSITCSCLLQSISLLFVWWKTRITQLISITACMFFHQVPLKHWISYICLFLVFRSWFVWHRQWFPLGLTSHLQGACFFYSFLCVSDLPRPLCLRWKCPSVEDKHINMFFLSYPHIFLVFII